jgi:ubiquinone/menaquinone biosynthesis C-methylase UbiE
LTVPMEGYRPSTYGDRIAPIYDELHGRLPAEAASDFLADAAGDGPALELGVGTGRIALPLAERGVTVHGIDASTAMLAKLRTKPGADRVTNVVGDFAHLPLRGPYALVFVAFNTFFNLYTQAEQVVCFEDVGRVLRRGGKFVVEAFVPDPTRWDRDQRVSVAETSLTGFSLDVTRHDPVTQRLSGHTAHITQEGIRLYPLLARYAWPSELDLMAHCAGLVLKDRWSSWTRQPFTSASTSHVSVYERSAGPR